jgi:hypothetical protein
MAIAMRVKTPREMLKTLLFDGWMFLADFFASSSLTTAIMRVRSAP